MRNRFLIQFYVGHSGARIFLKVISSKVRADWSWCLPNSKYQLILKRICTVIQQHFKSIHPDTLEGRHRTSIGSNFATNNLQKNSCTTMSDVKLCQETIPHVFITWKSTYRELLKQTWGTFKILVLLGDSWICRGSASWPFSHDTTP